MKVLEILIAIVLASYAAIAAIRWPRFGIVFWLAITCFVPSWLIVRIGVEWTPAGLCALVVLPVIFVRNPRRGWRTGDLVATAIVLLCLIAFWQGNTPKQLASQVIVRGLLGYLVSRHLAPRAGMRWTLNVFAGMLLICATWSIVEYLAGWHAFRSFDIGSSEGFWAAIQSRGGHARSEAAFGDAIALGGALAMALPFIFASGWRTSRKFIGLALIGFGILATISRGPMTAALVGIVLMILLYRSPNVSPAQRRVIIIGTLAVSIILYAGLVSKITAAGTEAFNSAAYRGKLYSYVLQDIRPISLADNVSYTQNQQIYREFGSVDSTFIYSALFYGWLPVALFMLSLLGLAWRALSQRAGPATIALLAQIPVLATVAPITQYETLLWFLGGLVVVETMPVRRPLRQPVSDYAAGSTSIPSLVTN